VLIDDADTVEQIAAKVHENQTRTETLRHGLEDTYKRENGLL